MNWAFDPVPNYIEVNLRDWLRSIVEDSVGIEQETITTLAAGASTTVSHSETDTNQILVQVYKTTGEKCTDSEIGITITDKETITITNNSGAALTNLTVNMCFR